MNKTAVKNFAVWARNKLRSEIAYKARLVGITEKCIAEPLPQSTGDLQIFDIGTSQPVKIEDEITIAQRNSLAAAIREKRLPYPEAFDAVIEEVAYTWFNRLIAVRFMEVNEYLPSRVRVLSSVDPDKAEPDFVTSPFETDLAFTSDEMDYIDECKDKSRLDELFQFLFIRQCNTLHEILPELFEKTNDYTELLLNVSFTDKDGVVWHLVHDVPENDFDIQKQGQVETLGWLYQYYNTEPKDKVFSRPSGQKIRKEDVPAATQLFTPDWIVRYMVENSLGRTWTDIKPDSDLKNEWKYYLPKAEQSEEVQAKLNSLRHLTLSSDTSLKEGGKVPLAEGDVSNADRGSVSPEEITFLDPCMGSGHILVYAFDVLMAIYTSQGYTERDATQRIVEKNLYGLEIDDRAAQLAYFAVMMKARFYDRRFFGRGIRPNVCSIRESNNLNTDYLELFGDLKTTARKLCDEFIDAKEYGSILNLKITADEISQLENKYNEIDKTTYDNIFDTIRQAGIRTDFSRLLKQAEIMIKKYDVVCTNPPYMGGSFSPKLDEYIKKNYADSKSDLFAVFIEKCGFFSKSGGYYAMITQHAWMFLSSYEKLRKKLQLKTTVNMAHLGARAFDEISGEVVQTTAFVNQNQHIHNYLGTYARLIDGKSENEKSTMLLSGKYNYTANADNFSKIPGSPVAYWVSENFIRAFANGKLSDNVNAVKGLDTCDNDTYTRLWLEVNIHNIGFDKADTTDTYSHKWYPYCKGGGYSKWYGFMERVVNWADDGKELRNLRNSDGKIKSRPQNTRYYFKEGLTWSTITSYKLSLRYMNNCIFGGGGSAMFCKDNLMFYLGFINSKITEHCLSILNPTLNFLVGDILSLPIIFPTDQSTMTTINELVQENIQLSKDDWDSYETSWDFKKHPLI